MTRRYYGIRAWMNSDFPRSVSSQQLKGEVMVGVHTRPAGHNHAMLENEELARSFLTALIPVYEKRYGQGVQLELIECGTSNYPGLQSKLDEHDAIVRERLVTGNFAPNRRVTVAVTNE